MYMNGILCYRFCHFAVRAAVVEGPYSAYSWAHALTLIAAKEGRRHTENRQVVYRRGKCQAQRIRMCSLRSRIRTKNRKKTREGVYEKESKSNDHAMVAPTKSSRSTTAERLVASG